MKSINFTVIISLFLFFMSGCSSISKSQLNKGISVNIEAKMKADIDVDMSKKIIGYAHGGYLFHLFKVSGNKKYIDGVYFNNESPSVLSFLDKLERVKAAAAFNAVKGTGADILVNPQYVVEESHWNPFYKTIKVKVTGFAGRVSKISNLR